MEKFRLDGIEYITRGGSCNQPSCKKCQAGEPHGPYWYTRDSDGKLKYLGTPARNKDLERILETQRMVEATKITMKDHADQLFHQARAINDQAEREIYEATKRIRAAAQEKAAPILAQQQAIITSLQGKAITNEQAELLETIGYQNVLAISPEARRAAARHTASQTGTKVKTKKVN